MQTVGWLEKPAQQRKTDQTALLIDRSARARAWRRIADERRCNQDTRA